jgi:hypothetical protein
MAMTSAKIDRRDSAGQNNRSANPNANMDQRDPAGIERGVEPVEPVEDADQEH